MHHKTQPPNIKMAVKVLQRCVFSAFMLFVSTKKKIVFGLGIVRAQKTKKPRENDKQRRKKHK